jgi:hypothetical protein
MSLWRTFYDFTSRNEPMEAKPLNPLPENAMSADTGNAGRDGYTVLSRASRATGERITVGDPRYEAPRSSEDY